MDFPWIIYGGFSDNYWFLNYISIMYTSGYYKSFVSLMLIIGMAASFFKFFKGNLAAVPVSFFFIVVILYGFLMTPTNVSLTDKRENETAVVQNIPLGISLFGFFQTYISSGLVNAIENAYGSVGIPKYTQTGFGFGPYTGVKAVEFINGIDICNGKERICSNLNRFIHDCFIYSAADVNRQSQTLSDISKMIHETDSWKYLLTGNYINPALTTVYTNQSNVSEDKDCKTAGESIYNDMTGTNGFSFSSSFKNFIKSQASLPSLSDTDLGTYLAASYNAGTSSIEDILRQLTFSAYISQANNAIASELEGGPAITANVLANQIKNVFSSQQAGILSLAKQPIMITFIRGFAITLLIFFIALALTPLRGPIFKLLLNFFIALTLIEPVWTLTNYIIHSMMKDKLAGSGCNLTIEGISKCVDVNLFIYSDLLNWTTSSLIGVIFLLSTAIVTGGAAALSRLGEAVSLSATGVSKHSQDSVEKSTNRSTLDDTVKWEGAFSSFREGIFGAGFNSMNDYRSAIESFNAYRTDVFKRAEARSLAMSDVIASSAFSAENTFSGINSKTYYNPTGSVAGQTASILTQTDVSNLALHGNMFKNLSEALSKKGSQLLNGSVTVYGNDMFKFENLQIRDQDGNSYIMNGTYALQNGSLRIVDGKMEKQTGDELSIINMGTDGFGRSYIREAKGTLGKDDLEMIGIKADAFKGEISIGQDGRYNIKGSLFTKDGTTNLDGWINKDGTYTGSSTLITDKGAISFNVENGKIVGTLNVKDSENTSTNKSSKMSSLVSLVGDLSRVYEKISNIFEKASSGFGTKVSMEDLNKALRGTEEKIAELEALKKQLEGKVGIGASTKGGISVGGDASFGISKSWVDEQLNSLKMARDHLVSLKNSYGSGLDYNREGLIGESGKIAKRYSNLAQESKQYEETMSKSLSNQKDINNAFLIGSSFNLSNLSESINSIKNKMSETMPDIINPDKIEKEIDREGSLTQKNAKGIISKANNSGAVDSKQFINAVHKAQEGNEKEVNDGYVLSKVRYSDEYKNFKEKQDDKFGNLSENVAKIVQDELKKYGDRIKSPEDQEKILRTAMRNAQFYIDRYGPENLENYIRGNVNRMANRMYKYMTKNTHSTSQATETANQVTEQTKAKGSESIERGSGNKANKERTERMGF